MMLEGLEGHRGTGIVVKAGISALWRRSGLIYEHAFTRRSHQKRVHASCVHNAESYTCIFRSGKRNAWQKYYTFLDLRYQNSNHLREKAYTRKHPIESAHNGYGSRPP